MTDNKIRELFEAWLPTHVPTKPFIYVSDIFNAFQAGYSAGRGEVHPLEKEIMQLERICNVTHEALTKDTTE